MTTENEHAFNKNYIIVVFVFCQCVHRPSSAYVQCSIFRQLLGWLQFSLTDIVPNFTYSWHYLRPINMQKIWNYQHSHASFSHYHQYRCPSFGCLIVS